MESHTLYPEDAPEFYQTKTNFEESYQQFVNSTDLEQFENQPQIPPQEPEAFHQEEYYTCMSCAQDIVESHIFFCANCSQTVCESCLSTTGKFLHVRDSCDFCAGITNNGHKIQFVCSQHCKNITERSAVINL